MSDRRSRARRGVACASAGAAIALLVIAGSAFCSDEKRDAASPAPPFPTVMSTADRSVLVLTHSWSGRTAVVGREWAEMLGARFLRFSDAPEPYSSLGVQGSTLEEIRPQLQLKGLRRIYLGFPIWARGPAPPTSRLLSEMDLGGIEIVPFFTYLHDVDEKLLTDFEQRLRAEGANVLARIEIRVPESMTPVHLERRAEQALLARPDLWSSEGDPVASCDSDAAPAGHILCRVTAGNVWVGDDGSDESPPGSGPARRVSVAAFDIDRTEVTIAQYRRCVEAGRCAAIDQYDPCSELVGDGDDKPVPCVSTDSARAYCQWLGLRLPNEAEWMRAARGDRAMPYPWGFSRPGASAVLRGNFGEKHGSGMPGYSLVEPERNWPADGVARLATGCSFPQGNSPFGVCDLAGNIGEWVEAVDGHSAPVFKGGTWMDGEEWAFRIASRGWMSLERKVTAIGYYLTGFRCAR